jgi:hypothetical protein
MGILTNETLQDYQNFQTAGCVFKKDIIEDFGGFKSSIKLTFNGVSFDIPIGESDPASGLTGGGATGGTDADTELSNGSTQHTISVKLVATSSAAKSNFDY